MIGTIIIPILGAVPEGAIVLFSGLGAKPQQTAAVGIGTLAGSSIMLLTINWGLVILAGRVDHDNSNIPNHELKLTNVWNVTSTGVTNNRAINIGGWQVIASLIPFLLMEICSIGQFHGGLSHENIRIPAYIAIALTLIIFII